MDLSHVISEISRSGARFAATLTDTELRSPSMLPGWTRGHVAAHVARSADACVWLLAVARTGAEPAPRAGTEALARAVEADAARPAAALVADVRASLARLVEDAESMPAEAWDTLVTALAGWRHPAWYTLYRCWRELETHHVDLNAGYSTADWPTAYVAWALDDTLATLSAHNFPIARIEAVDLARSWNPSPTGPTISAHGHTLLGWLSGRTPNATLTTDGPVPNPPNWPLPPAPGWN
ncbi:maleylpyruvate isomerase family mycothiol-dependent enzyme [Streptomyces sp. ISL-98]|uniref:maleylpyruvate isomerase family mycothiol-dependent enzyme n=1 Tax=Streptomyces sp. ISL-98 TaxID=2819192 RepID=UPI001BE87365|nr:maleylpyruvate isomerase family mycothiol-dependent enzyme [Streptomyces sp. ISL-98]MBT2506908.1 maleylpyruvate isomerase family mycothiol-dependent enzyme [Streptomyces sp. ISL-98]